MADFREGHELGRECGRGTLGRAGEMITGLGNGKLGFGGSEEESTVARGGDLARVGVVRSKGQGKFRESNPWLR